jgi:hypothetical protein
MHLIVADRAINGAHINFVATLAACVVLKTPHATPLTWTSNTTMKC